MALDQAQMEQQQAPEEERLTDEEETDLNIMVNLAKELIDDGGIDVIERAVEQSNDPGQVIGQFLMQMVSQLGEQLPEEVNISPRIFFSYGGWVEQVSDYLQEQYDIPTEAMDRAEMYIGTAAQQMQQGQAAKAQPAAEQAPAMPAGGPV